MKDKIYLFANWKMYLDFDESNILANGLAGEAKKFGHEIKMAIFPSTLSLYTAGQVLRDVGVGVGPQNVFWVDKGGYTGEISASMYKTAGCDYALVGHSERRQQFHETNHEVRQKMDACLSVGLTPVLCVGETLKEREAGTTAEVVEIQLRSALDNISWPKNVALIIAYEPVWAISKGAGAGEEGRHCDDIEAEKMHRLIKKIVKNLLPNMEPAVLFGGSVRPNTTAYYLNQPSIDGVLVGAASTKLDSWLEIVKNAGALV
ncbi:MAG: triose-phosphate isomerase [Candidatus Magasanikbacteria bacterium]|jgi:triosephosphate isomerase